MTTTSSPASFTIWHESLASAREDRAGNLSTGSVAVVTDRPLPVGTRVFVELPAAPGKPRAGVDAEVAEVEPGGMWLAFASLDAFARAEIERLAPQAPAVDLAIPVAPPPPPPGAKAEAEDAPAALSSAATPQVGVSMPAATPPTAVDPAATQDFFDALEPVSQGPAAPALPQPVEAATPGPGIDEGFDERTPVPGATSAAAPSPAPRPISTPPPVTAAAAGPPAAPRPVTTTFAPDEPSDAGFEERTPVPGAGPPPVAAVAAPAPPTAAVLVPVVAPVVTPPPSPIADAPPAEWGARPTEPLAQLFEDEDLAGAPGTEAPVQVEAAPAFAVPPVVADTPLPPGAGAPLTEAFPGLDSTPGAVSHPPNLGADLFDAAEAHPDVSTASGGWPAVDVRTGDVVPQPSAQSAAPPSAPAESDPFGLMAEAAEPPAAAPVAEMEGQASANPLSGDSVPDGLAEPPMLVDDFESVEPVAAESAGQVSTPDEEPPMLEELEPIEPDPAPAPAPAPRVSSPFDSVLVTPGSEPIPADEVMLFGGGAGAPRGLDLPAGPLGAAPLSSPLPPPAVVAEPAPVAPAPRAPVAPAGLEDLLGPLPVARPAAAPPAHRPGPAPLDDLFGAAPAPPRAATPPPRAATPPPRAATPPPAAVAPFPAPPAPPFASAEQPGMPRSMPVSAMVMDSVPTEDGSADSFFETEWTVKPVAQAFSDPLSNPAIPVAPPAAPPPPPPVAAPPAPAHQEAFHVAPVHAAHAPPPQVPPPAAPSDPEREDFDPVFGLPMPTEEPPAEQQAPAPPSRPEVPDFPPAVTDPDGPSPFLAGPPASLVAAAAQPPLVASVLVDLGSPPVPAPAQPAAPESPARFDSMLGVAGLPAPTPPNPGNQAAPPTAAPQQFDASFDADLVEAVAPSAPQAPPVAAAPPSMQAMAAVAAPQPTEPRFPTPRPAQAYSPTLASVPAVQAPHGPAPTLGMPATPAFTAGPAVFGIERAVEMDPAARNMMVAQAQTGGFLVDPNADATADLVGAGTVAIAPDVPSEPPLLAGQALPLDGALDGASDDPIPLASGAEMLFAHPENTFTQPPGSAAAPGWGGAPGQSPLQGVPMEDSIPPLVGAVLLDPEPAPPVPPPSSQAPHSGFSPAPRSQAGGRTVTLDDIFGAQGSSPGAPLAPPPSSPFGFPRSGSAPPAQESPDDLPPVIGGQLLPAPPPAAPPGAPFPQPGYPSAAMTPTQPPAPASPAPAPGKSALDALFEDE